MPGADVVNKLEHNSALGEVLASGLRALNADPRCSEVDLRATHGNHRPRRGAPARALPEHAGTIASAAPLLGLLGTVIGMIEIFGSQSPAGGATGGNPAQLAHGISVALYNTAFGLIIAIPSLIFWRYFRVRVDEYLLTLELAAERFARHLNALRSADDAAVCEHRMNFRHAQREEPEINLIPFIDVLLVVLIFLMLSTTYSKFTELQITLPVADADAQRDYPKEVIVARQQRRQATSIKGAAGAGRSVEAVALRLDRGGQGRQGQRRHHQRRRHRAAPVA